MNRLQSQERRPVWTLQVLLKLCGTAASRLQAHDANGAGHRPSGYRTVDCVVIDPGKNIMHMQTVSNYPINGSLPVGIIRQADRSGHLLQSGRSPQSALVRRLRRRLLTVLIANQEHVLSPKLMSTSVRPCTGDWCMTYRLTAMLPTGNDALRSDSPGRAGAVRGRILRCGASLVRLQIRSRTNNQRGDSKSD